MKRPQPTSRERIRFQLLPHKPTRQTQVDVSDSDPFLLFGLPELPGHDKLAVLAEALFLRLTQWKELTTCLLAFTAVHVGLRVRTQASGSPLAGCAAVGAWQLLAHALYLCVTLTVIVTRDYSGSLNATFESVWDITTIFLGTFLNAGVSMIPELATDQLNDVCSNTIVSTATILLAELSGIFSLIKNILSTYGNPWTICGQRLPAWLSCLCAVTIAVTFQLTVLDLFIIPTLGRTIRQQELESTPLDDILDRWVGNGTM